MQSSKTIMNQFALESNESILNSGEYMQTGCEFTPIDFTTMADLDALNIYSDPINFDTSFITPEINLFAPDALNPMQTDLFPLDNATIDNTVNQVLDSDASSCVDEEYAALIDGWLQNIREQQQEKGEQEQQDEQEKQQEQEQQQHQEEEQQHQQQQQQHQTEEQEKEIQLEEAQEQQIHEDQEEEEAVGEVDGLGEDVELVNEVEVSEEEGDDLAEEEVEILEDEEDDELLDEGEEEEDEQMLEEELNEYDEGEVEEESQIQRKKGDIYEEMEEEEIDEAVVIEEEEQLVVEDEEQVVVVDDEQVVVEEQQEQQIQEEALEDKEQQIQQEVEQQQMQQEEEQEEQLQQVPLLQEQQRQQQNQRLQQQQRQQQQQHLVYLQQQQRQQHLQQHLHSVTEPLPLMKSQPVATLQLPSANNSIYRKCKITSIPLTNIQPLNNLTKEKYCNIQITVQSNDNDKRILKPPTSSTDYGIPLAIETNGTHHNTNLPKGYISYKNVNTQQILQKSVTHSNRIQQSISNNGLTLKQKCSEVSFINSLDKLQSKEMKTNLIERTRGTLHRDLSPTAHICILKSLHYRTPRHRCIILRPAYQIKYIPRQSNGNLTIFQRNPDLLNDTNKQKCKDFNTLPDDFDNIIMSVPFETDQEFAIKPIYKCRRQRKQKFRINPDSENIDFVMEYINLNQNHKATTTCEFTLDADDADHANDKNNNDNDDYDYVEDYDDDDDDDNSKVMTDLYPDVELPEIEELFKRKKGNNTTTSAAVTASNRHYSHKIKANNIDFDDTNSKLKRKECKLKSPIKVEDTNPHCLDGRIDNAKAAKRPYLFVQSEECKYMNYSDTDSEGTVELKERILASKSLRCDKCRKLFKTLRSLIIHIKRSICKIQNNSIKNSGNILTNLPYNR